MTDEAKAKIREAKSPNNWFKTHSINELELWIDKLLAEIAKLRAHFPEPQADLLHLAAQCLQVTDAKIRADPSWERDRAEFMQRFNKAKASGERGVEEVHAAAPGRIRHCWEERDRCNDCPVDYPAKECPNYDN